MCLTIDHVNREMTTGDFYGPMHDDCTKAITGTENQRSSSRVRENMEAFHTMEAELSRTIIIAI